MTATFSPARKLRVDGDDAGFSPTFEGQLASLSQPGSCRLLEIGYRNGALPSLTILDDIKEVLGQNSMGLRSRVHDIPE